MRTKRKILVVDDEQAIADTLAALLKYHGFDVYVAYSGTQALELAFQIKPDLVVSDLMMPDTDGIEVVRVLKARLPQCRTILFSGSMLDVNLLRAARACGYDGEILVKPVHPSDLLAKLNGPVF